MRRFATIKQDGQPQLTALGCDLLLEQSKQQRNQVDKDGQLFPVNLNKEDSVERNLHSVSSFQPPKSSLWGLIALSAICAHRSQNALHTTLQSIEACKEITALSVYPREEAIK